MRNTNFHILLILFFLFGCRESLEPNRSNIKKLVEDGNFELTIQHYGGNIAGSYKGEITEIKFSDSLKVYVKGIIFRNIDNIKFDTNFIISPTVYEEAKNFVIGLTNNSLLNPGGSCVGGDHEFHLKSDKKEIRIYSTEVKDHYLKLFEILSLYSSYNDSILLENYLNEREKKFKEINDLKSIDSELKFNFEEISLEQFNDFKSNKVKFDFKEGAIEQFQFNNSFVKEAIYIDSNTIILKTYTNEGDDYLNLFKYRVGKRINY